MRNFSKYVLHLPGDEIRNKSGISLAVPRGFVALTIEQQIRLGGPLSAVT
jgi:hypothetical protein